MYWPVNTGDFEVNIYSKLTNKTDLIVVGSGMSGSLCAYELLKAGY